MVRIIQCLCPQRHCIMAIAYDPDGSMSSEDVMAGFRELVRLMVETKVIKPWCHLCNSRDWHYEDEKTIFKDVEEAKPHMRAMEEAQRQVNQSVNRN